ncbi:MAG: SUMF1/EgtB/PvdO family nonheme iron enzyme [Gemmatimonadetes bacterium]|nr:SUMF1/EgtB/PvdO family nonheme iron enzyme [Gemmatimonadota bacterium]MYK54316.1 SUMF1/EgtB/PvdO family nonheme iron enzyme [Gemmatimonadota bacterium]
MNEAQQPLNALPQGHRLQEYELVRVLGFGGFGMTYLGFDHNLDKAVAIKEYLPSDIATRTGDNSVVPQASQFRGDFEWGLDRFVDEARALARFDHRHIIKVHRFFEAHGTAYIVMEYAEGETLSAFLERKGTLKESELKSILYPILDGLEVVHRADFLHRDIKPGNIIIRDEDNSPVLLDFGSARQAIGARSRSVTSIITPGYAPIEQYSSRGDQGPWTDIYTLGGVCYRALTGEVPDDATDRMRDDPLIPVVERCAGQASAGFLSAIDWALAVDEGDRPQSVAAWRVALEGEVPGSVDEELSVTRSETATRSEVQDQERDDAPPVHHSTKSKGKLFVAFACVVALWACAVVYYYYLPDQRRRTQEAVGVDAARESARRQEQRVVGRFRDCNECPEMVVVPSGSFTMGSPSGEKGHDDEGPRHAVRIDYRFAVGVYEVTFAEWDACADAGGCDRYVSDEGWGRGNRPVINVSWKDAQSYVRWLSARTGHKYGLLSESEWEYVARSGTDTRYSWGNEIGRNRANCDGCGSRWDADKTALVGSFRANAWGIHDMHGNVWEWVEDCWNDSYVGAPTDGSAWESGSCDRRVLRGGSWYDEPWVLRSANRSGIYTVIRDLSNGFRVALRF